LIHRLTDSLYGTWVLLLSLTGYGVLLDFGIRSSIVKYVSQYNATSDKAGLNDVFNTSLRLYTAAGLILMIFALILTPFLPRLFNIPSGHVMDAKIVFIIVCLNLAFKFPAGVFEGFLTGLQRYDLTNAVTILRE